jgi:hypothetical protein
MVKRIQKEGDMEFEKEEDSIPEQFRRIVEGPQEENIDQTGPQYQELMRRREAGEIDQTDYEVNYLSYLQEMGTPISRSDLKNQAIVINPKEFESLGYIEFVSSSDEVMTIDLSEADNSKPFILFPEDLGDLVTEKHPENEPTLTELVNACREVLTDEDCTELENMEFGEALGYSITLLIEQGIDNPEQFLREKRIVE